MFVTGSEILVRFRTVSPGEEDRFLDDYRSSDGDFLSCVQTAEFFDRKTHFSRQIFGDVAEESLCPDLLKDELGFGVSFMFTAAAAVDADVTPPADVGDAGTVAFTVGTAAVAAAAVVAVVTTANPLLRRHEKVHVAQDLGSEFPDGRCSLRRGNIKAKLERIFVF